ncbi:EAL domain-containing protein [Ferrovibrio sp.]|uniref:EAL domain-containing protein n=1 Tax=Ferrovibrio sp. TaxID=1917215 RepID=UPI003120501E
MSEAVNQNQITTDDEKMLTDFDRLMRGKIFGGRLAAVLQFVNPKTFERNRESYNIVVHSIRSLMSKYEGTFYTLHDYSIVLFVRLSERFFDQTFEKLVLEIDDILTRNNIAIGLTPEEAENAVRWYRFDSQLDEMQDWMDGLQQRFRTFTERRKRLLAKAGTAAGQGEGAPLTPGALQQIDDILKKADVSTFMKRQPVAVCFGNQPPKPIFQEIFVGVNELRQAIAPNVNLRGARSLFHHLTRTLDTRVFRSLLDGYVSRNSGPFSINLNVSTILSDTFRDFDSRIGNIVKKEQIIIELQRYDVFWDYGEYLLACEFLHNSGYRLLLDGITPDLLALFGRKELKADFIKLFYFRDRHDEWTAKDIASRIADADANRVIMARCETEEALKAGMAAGIRLFQGWHIDNLIRASREVVN